MKKTFVKALGLALSLAVLATTYPTVPAQAKEFLNEKAYGDPVTCTVNHYLGSISEATLLESKLYDRSNTEGMAEGYEFTAPLSPTYSGAAFNVPEAKTITLQAENNVINYIYTVKQSETKVNYTVHHQVYIPSLASSYEDGNFTEIKTVNVNNITSGTTVTPAVLTSEELDAALADTSVVKINNKSIKEALGYDASFFAIPTAKNLTVTADSNEITYTYNKVKAKYSIRIWTEMGFTELQNIIIGHEREYEIDPKQPTDSTIYVRKIADDIVSIGNINATIDTSTLPIPNRAGYNKPEIVTSSATIGLNDDTVVDVYYNLTTKPSSTYFDQTFTHENITYNLDNTGNATVVNFSKDASGNVTIPSSVTVYNMTYTVTGIGDCAFKNNTKITSVVIPSSVKVIGDSAFYGCTNLKSVTIPNSVTNIGSYAFAKSGLTAVNIPSSVVIIGVGAFSECLNLTAIIFAANSQLVTIPAKFAYGSTKLTSITIPASVVMMGASAFEKCTSLKTVTFASNSNLTNISPKAFMGTAIAKITIPVRVKKIGSSAFMNCKSLKSITIKSKSISTIGSKAFKGINKKAKFKLQKANKEKTKKKLSKKSVGYVKTWKIK